MNRFQYSPREVEKFKKEFYYSNGIPRYYSNGRICPPSVFKEYGIPVTEAHASAYEADLREFLSQVVDHEMTREQMMEARAAHGEGVTLVNVLTGRKFKT